jgi:hypothetical protein
MFYIDLAFLLLALASVLIRRRRVIAVVSVSLLLWQMWQVVLDPGTVHRLAVDSATREQLSAGFYGGISAMQHPMDDLFYSVGLSILCWPLLVVAALLHRSRMEER